MQETKHTPGPWIVHEKVHPAFVCSIADGVIGNVICEPPTWNESRVYWPGNARLIAAAPDMLEVLEAVKPLMIPGMNWTDKTGEMIKGMVSAAIAKATGAKP